MEPVSQPIVLREIPDQVVQEVNQGLNELTSELEDLTAIQKDFTSVVGQQGEQVKSVEERTTQVAQAVVHGVASLKQAETYQNKFRSMKLYIAAGGAAGLVLGVATCIVLPPIGTVGSIMGIIVLAGSGAGVASYLTK
jgi:t-SNARE complex subunit (syntaxin)